MGDQAAAKKILNALSKREDLGNKVCCDCSNPNPQWASLGFAILVCLQCAGTHRGFGVHISFVRSISMDTWQEDQIKRMQLGGNQPFKEFMKSYQPAEQGGYKEGASAHDTYHSWAAAQYREKLDCMVSGKDWSPSAPTAIFQAASRSASPAPSNQGLRKSRANARGLTGRSNSQSPAPSPSGTPNPDQKTANENYFNNLGKLNESRPDHLPPSQGGRYGGFGNTPSPGPGQHPLSSANAPTLTELQDNPVAAISKGWSLFAAAVVGATRVVNESVIQPGVERVSDPDFQAGVKGYLTEAQQKAASVGSTANEWSKHQFGVDVADSVGGAIGAVRERVAGPSHAGYGQVALTSPNGTDNDMYQDDNDLFSEYRDTYSQPSLNATAASLSNTTPSSTKPPATKKNDWDDEWKDF
ncbi:ArfGap-domain-containing protein [Crepidotus variabilis]|uniref:ArfGap-domain-containing protein n=1 Tax=Crepidotus variabilis TaxID=179855 RepID=A0A9P6ETP1_9AGAR|nr:ArfGap-domain-containing protein [Crepidotus variabilis]